MNHLLEFAESRLLALFLLIEDDEEFYMTCRNDPVVKDLAQKLVYEAGADGLVEESWFREIIRYSFKSWAMQVFFETRQ